MANIAVRFLLFLSSYFPLALIFFVLFVGRHRWLAILILSVGDGEPERRPARFPRAHGWTKNLPCQTGAGRHRRRECLSPRCFDCGQAPPDGPRPAEHSRSRTPAVLLIY